MSLMQLKASLGTSLKDESYSLIKAGPQNLRPRFQSTLPALLALLFLFLVTVCLYFNHASHLERLDPDSEIQLYQPGNLTVENITAAQPDPPTHPLDFQANQPDVIKYLKGNLMKDRYEGGFDIPNPGICPDSGANLKVLILISSARNNHPRRMAIRQTWGHYAHRKDIATGFIVGRSKYPEHNSKIQEEQDLHGDIIAGKFVDTYPNLTLKTTAMLEWATTYCPQVKYVLKADDDVFVNVPKVLDIVATKKDETRAIFGRLFMRWQTPRDSGFKHYISPDDYGPSILPDYVHGPGYLITGDIKKDLYEMALNTPYFLLEDCFYTGFMATAIGARKIGVDCSFELKEDSCKLKTDMWIVTRSSQELYDLWKRHLEDYTPHTKLNKYVFDYEARENVEVAH